MRLLFYDWELAVPPEYCAYNTGCNSTAVCVVSVSVSGGALCVLALKQAGKDRQYRANAGVLRRARTTCSTQPAPRPRPDDRSPAAGEARSRR